MFRKEGTARSKALREGVRGGLLAAMEGACWEDGGGRELGQTGGGGWPGGTMTGRGWASEPFPPWSGLWLQLWARCRQAVDLAFFPVAWLPHRRGPPFTGFGKLPLEGLVRL